MEGSKLGTERHGGEQNGGDQKVVVLHGKVMPVEATPLAMPISASPSFSHPRALKQKLIASSCAKFNFQPLCRTKSSQNPNLVYTKISSNTSGQKEKTSFEALNKMGLRQENFLR